MSKRQSTLGTALSILGLIMVTSGRTLHAQAPVSPTPSSGWEQIIPGTTTWGEASAILGRMGYAFDSPYQTDAFLDRYIQHT